MSEVIDMLAPAAIIVFVLLALKVIIGRPKMTVSEMISQRLHEVQHRPPPPMPDRIDPKQYLE